VRACVLVKGGGGDTSHAASREAQRERWREVKRERARGREEKEERHIEREEGEERERRERERREGGEYRRYTDVCFLREGVGAGTRRTRRKDKALDVLNTFFKKCVYTLFLWLYTTTFFFQQEADLELGVGCRLTRVREMWRTSRQVRRRACVSSERARGERAFG
jgi:hypothetical protein